MIPPESSRATGNGRWRSVTRSHPCPACDHLDWCAWSPDGRTLRCMRARRTPPGMRYVARDRDGAHLYVVESEDAPAPPAAPAGDAPSIDATEFANRCHQRLTEDLVARLAQELGVGREALTALEVGWANAQELRALKAGWDGPRPDGAYTVPTRSSDGHISGLDLRSLDGRKSAPKGLPRGLIFAPASLQQDGDVLLVEGASDVATLLTLGVPAVGRSSVTAGGDILAELLRHRAEDVVVLGERDRKANGTWPGRDGALHIARHLAEAWGRPVRWALPPSPAKDVRAWLASRMAGHEHGEFLQPRLYEDLMAALQADMQTVEPTARGMAGPVSRCLADIQLESIEWLWWQRLALGKLTVIAGNGGVGKSTLTLDLAARISVGAAVPDRPDKCFSVGKSILINAEDNPGDTIRPRLEAAGANLEHIHILDAVRDPHPGAGEPVERGFNLATDIRHLEALLEELGDVKLVVIDPITAYLGKADDHRNAEIRGLLAPLATFAAKHRVAVLAVTHLNKGQNEVIHRIVGSIAWGAAARTVLAVAKDKKDDNRRLVFVVKTNIAPEVASVAYRIESSGTGGEVGIVHWDTEPVEVTAEEALGPSKRGPTPDERQQAEQWLAGLLADEPLPAREIERRAKEADLSMGTVQRAKRSLRIRSFKDGLGGWMWMLRGEPTSHIQNLRTFTETCAPSDGEAKAANWMVAPAQEKDAFQSFSAEGDQDVQVPTREEACADATPNAWPQMATALLSRCQDNEARTALWDQYEERAAIAHFDGGVTLDEAERLAFLEIEDCLSQSDMQPAVPDASATAPSRRDACSPPAVRTRQADCGAR